MIFLGPLERVADENMSPVECPMGPVLYYILSPQIHMLETLSLPQNATTFEDRIFKEVIK